MPPGQGDDFFRQQRQRAIELRDAEQIGDAEQNQEQRIVEPTDHGLVRDARDTPQNQRESDGQKPGVHVPQKPQHDGEKQQKQRNECHGKTLPSKEIYCKNVRRADDEASALSCQTYYTTFPRAVKQKAPANAGTFLRTSLFFLERICYNKR